MNSIKAFLAFSQKFGTQKFGIFSASSNLLCHKKEVHKKEKHFLAFKTYLLFLRHPTTPQIFLNCFQILILTFIRINQIRHMSDQGVKMSEILSFFKRRLCILNNANVQGSRTKKLEKNEKTASKFGFLVLEDGVYAFFKIHIWNL